MLWCDDIIYFRQACSIPDSDTVTITGGYFSPDKVTRYSRDGQATSLPPLQTDRWSHACGHYTDENNNKVSKTIVIVHCLSNVHFCYRFSWSQATGFTGSQVLTPGASKWTAAASLPRAVRGLRQEFQNVSTWETWD